MPVDEQRSTPRLHRRAQVGRYPEWRREDGPEHNLRALLLEREAEVAEHQLVCIGPAACVLQKSQEFVEYSITRTYIIQSL